VWPPRVLPPASVKECQGVETNHGGQQRPGTAEKPQVNEDQYVTCFETLHVGGPRGCPLGLPTCPSRVLGGHQAVHVGLLPARTPPWGLRARLDRHREDAGMRGDGLAAMRRADARSPVPAGAARWSVPAADGLRPGSRAGTEDVPQSGQTVRPGTRTSYHSTPPANTYSISYSAYEWNTLATGMCRTRRR
jgi:hypothetical protein